MPARSDQLHGVCIVVIPAERPGEDFFRFQKFVTYGLRVAILSDIPGQVARSNSLRDLVYQTNRGNQCWFVSDLDELDKRLEQEKARTAGS
jgi:hypothetical protein